MRVVYCVYGKEKHVRHLQTSVSSLKRIHPDARIEVFTTPGFADRLADLGVDIRLLDGMTPNDSDWHDPKMKIESIRRACGSAFLYLDNDTYIAGSLRPAWDLLEQFDCMGVQAPIYDQRGFLGLPPVPDLPAIPEAFVEWNTGVLFVSDRPAAQDLIENWSDLISRGYEGGGDQWLFRIALWQARGRFHVLPPVYNCRLPLRPTVYGEIRVLHGVHPDFPALAARLNADLGPR